MDILGDAIKAEIKAAVREAVADALKSNGHGEHPALLSSAQVAKQFSVPESWVSEQARKRTIPSVRLGHYVRFKPEDVERIIAQNENGKEKNRA